MNFFRKTDILISIVIPVILGLPIYLFKDLIYIPTLVKNHLADGLWAYAFISSILIIWDREINWVWVISTFIIAVCYELLQYCHTIPGTGDIYDVVTYFLFFGIALKLNHFFKLKFQF